MGKFIFSKFVYSVIVLWGVITSIFFLFNVLPGDPATIMLGQRANKEQVEAIHKDLGLDLPIFTQYFLYLNDLSPLSIHNSVNKNSHWYFDKEKYLGFTLIPFGEKILVLKIPYLRRSYITKRPVSDIILETLPETTVLAFSSIIVSSILGILLGILAAIKLNTWYDKISLVLSVLGMAAPSFFVGLIIAWLFGYVLRDYTGLSPTGSLYELDVWEGEKIQIKNLILPAITLGVRPLAIIVQLMRSSLLDVMSQDYIRTARAKGLSFYTIVFKHALKNALNPVVTAISGWFAGLMAGAVFVEYIFNWKGIGYEVYEALTKNDLPVVMGATLVFATIFVLTNMIVDIIYGFLDPRVRIK
ncbi:MAG: peptide ABC transporter permease [Bacteroidia bacterium]|nr:MAG: peptide ABC transporter permease [Bacteroidia bacterium]